MKQKGQTLGSAQIIVDSTIKISNRLSDDVDKLNVLCQEIESKLENTQNIGRGEGLETENRFSGNKEAVKKVSKYRE